MKKTWGYEILRNEGPGVYALADGRRLVVARYRRPGGKRMRCMRVVPYTLEAAMHVREELQQRVREHPPGPKRRGQGHIYFAEAVGTGRIKIGWTKKDPEVRLYGMRTDCPFAVRLLGTIRGTLQDERALHEQFAATRVDPSKEWFFASEELLKMALGGRDGGVDDKDAIAKSAEREKGFEPSTSTLARGPDVPDTSEASRNPTDPSDLEEPPPTLRSRPGGWKGGWIGAAVIAAAQRLRQVAVRVTLPRRARGLVRRRRAA